MGRILALLRLTFLSFEMGRILALLRQGHTEFFEPQNGVNSSTLMQGRTDLFLSLEDGPQQLQDSPKWVLETSKRSASLQYDAFEVGEK